jgi:type II secretory pathway predicted ATPase ExeA
MYQAYWGLSKSPFRGHLDLQAFHRGPAQDEALARMHFLVEERRTLGLVLGDTGTGKSLLLEIFASELGSNKHQWALLGLLGIGRREFLWQLAGELGIESRRTAGEAVLHRAIDDHLIANRFQQLSTVLLLDDVDEAAPEVLSEVVRLALYNQTHDAGLTIVLAAHPERLSRLGDRLLELAELRVDLLGWEVDDTAALLKKSLADAGRTTPIFSEAAVQRIHDLSGGVPRRIKQLADLALVGGAGSNLAQIEPDLVELVYQELGVETTLVPGRVNF